MLGNRYTLAKPTIHDLMASAALPKNDPAAESTGGHGEFSLSEARTIVGEFFGPNPWIYWPDFLVSLSIGVAAFPLVEFPHMLVSDPA